MGRPIRNRRATSARLGAAVVVSSHLLSQIEPLCSHFLILRTGTKIAGGTKDEIRTQVQGLGEGASLEDIFFSATEGGASELAPAAS